MRISNFHRLFCCVFFRISTANLLQSIEWDRLKLQSEMIRMNEKFNYVVDGMEKLMKNSSQDRMIKQLSMELQQSMDEILVTKKENSAQYQLITELSDELQQSKADLKNVEKENSVLNQLIKQILMDVKQLNFWMNDMKKENYDQDQLILKQSFDKIIEVKKEMSAIKRKDKIMEVSVSLTKPQIYSRFFDEYYKKKPDFTWVINDIQNKMKQPTFVLLSEIFLLKGYSFGAQAKFAYVRDKRTYVSLSFKDVIEEGQGLNLTHTPAVYFTLKDQRSSKSVMRHATAQSPLKYDFFYYDSWLMTASHEYNDSVSIDVHVEPPWVAHQAYSYDGALVWAIPDFKKKRELAKVNAQWYQLSPYFYTGPKGYRVQVYARMNGHWEYWDKGLTVSINFLNSPNDTSLSKSFPHKTTVTLLHPTEPANHLIKTVDEDVEKQRSYNMHMATHDEIDHLLDRDTLYYQVAIVPL